jgi:hypothetical protein
LRTSSPPPHAPKFHSDKKVDWNVTEAAASTNDRESARAKRPQSAVTSGRRLFIESEVDPNSAWSRRFRDLTGLHVADCGGAGALSAAKLSLCRRAAALEVAMEAMEGRMAAGEAVDVDRYGRAASHLRRILETLGLERKARDVSALNGSSVELFEPFSPMRSRWAAEEAAKAAESNLPRGEVLNAEAE